MDRLAAFFDLVNQDPIVSQVKLIAEPWDVGEGGYQVGGFPPLWTEWNGKYRDTVRDFWRGEPAEPRGVRLPVHRQRRTCTRPTAAGPSRRSTSSPRTTGSPCNDLVSYNEKHNEANGEGNRDGESHNRSWNRGVEGPTDDGEILVAARTAEAQLPGDAAAVPGRADDRARRRAGPHPAGQQQRLLPGQRAQLGRLGRRAGARGAHRVHRAAGRSCAPSTRSSAGGGSSRAARSRARSIDDIAWLRPDGQPMTDAGLDRRHARTLGDLPQRPGHPGPRRARRAGRSTTRSCCCSTPTTTRCTFTLPDQAYGRTWEVVVDTADPLLANTRRRQPAPGSRHRLPPRTMHVLRSRS